MAERESPARREVHAVLRYGLAVASVAVALIATLPLGPTVLMSPPFFLAVIVSAWFGGGRPGLLAAVLGTLALAYFVLPPTYSLLVDPPNRIPLLMFALAAVFVSWLGAVTGRRLVELRRARDELETRVQERTADLTTTNEKLRAEISERQRVEATLKEHAALLDLTHDSVVAKDMNDVITYWNRGAEELYGWKAEQAIGQRAHELLKPVLPVAVDEILAELLRAGRWEGDLDKTRADGTQVAVASRWSLRRDAQQRPAAILETNNDITDRLRREQEIRRSIELQASNKELEAFAYSISHDLRAPLRHIAGYGELLRKNAAARLDDKSRRYLTLILDAARRMESLIDDLLAFSRISRAETRKAHVSLDALVKEALDDVRPEMENRDIEWTVRALPEVNADRAMLRLCLVNLLSNAIKFTRTRPKAEIEIGCLRTADGETSVFVRDNGVGFDMRYADKLFGVFQRLHAADVFEGTGIGLATVQRIIHRHDGRVWAEGVVEGGATFYFAIPNRRGSANDG